MNLDWIHRARFCASPGKDHSGLLYVAGSVQHSALACRHIKEIARVWRQVAIFALLHLRQKWIASQFATFHAYGSKVNLVGIDIQ